MKLFHFLFAVVLFGASNLFFSCDNEPQPPTETPDDGIGEFDPLIIDIPVEKGYLVHIDSVQAYFVDDNTKAITVMDQVPYEGGAFVMSLTYDLGKSFLKDEVADFFGLGSGIDISDPTARVGYLRFGFRGIKKGEEDGYFLMQNAANTGYLYTWTYFYFTDKDFTLKGNEVDYYGDLHTYDVAFKKGWNLMITTVHAEPGKSKQYDHHMRLPEDSYWQYYK